MRSSGHTLNSMKISGWFSKCGCGPLGVLQPLCPGQDGGAGAMRSTNFQNAAKTSLAFSLTLSHAVHSGLFQCDTVSSLERGNRCWDPAGSITRHQERPGNTLLSPTHYTDRGREGSPHYKTHLHVMGLVIFR